MNPNGNVIWAKGIHGNNYEYLSQLSIDGNQHIWITGISFSTEINVGNLSITPENAHSLMIYKFSGTGDVLVGKAIDLSSANGGFCCISATADQVGNYYISGSVGSFTQSFLIEGDAIMGTGIIKFDQNGDYVWSKTFQNSVENNFTIRDLKIGAGQFLYATGYLKGEVLFDTLSITVEPMGIGVLSYFLARYDLNGAINWVKNSEPISRFGGISLVTHQDKIYVLGSYQTELQIDSFFIGSRGQNSNDIFLIRHNSRNGDVEWLKGIGSPANDGPRHIAVNSQGQIYASGEFPDYNTVIDGIVLANSFGSYTDSWVARLGRDSLPPVELPPPDDKWIVYPSPFEETFTVYGNFDQGETDIELMDLSGRLVYRNRAEVIPTQYRYMISLPHIADGLYILHLIQNGQSQTLKILKQSM